MTCYVTHITQEMCKDATAFIRQANAAYMNQLEHITAHIRENSKTCPIILLSGPSGSGKTTTARILESLLDRQGLETHTLSLDDYFCTLTPAQHALLARGEFDLESPLRVDAPFLNEQLESLIAGRPTRLPRFDFQAHTRRDSEQILTRKPGELIILEGIHALNPSVITIPDTQTVRLYVSVRTRLETPDGARLHPQKIRLLRRMLRDTLFRGRKITDTLGMYPSVQQGEARYIMPYKTRSSFDVDTFIPYECGVYRRHLIGALQSLADHPDIQDLLPALEQLTDVDETLVPPESVIREFIGGSPYHA